MFVKMASTELARFNRRPLSARLKDAYSYANGKESNAHIALVECMERAIAVEGSPCTNTPAEALKTFVLETLREQIKSHIAERGVWAVSSMLNEQLKFGFLSEQHLFKAATLVGLERMAKLVERILRSDIPIQEINNVSCNFVLLCDAAHGLDSDQWEMLLREVLLEIKNKMKKYLVRISVIDFAMSLEGDDSNSCGSKEGLLSILSDDEFLIKQKLMSANGADVEKCEVMLRENNEIVKIVDDCDWRKMAICAVNNDWDDGDWDKMNRVFLRDDVLVDLHLNNQYDGSEQMADGSRIALGAVLNYLMLSGTVLPNPQSSQHHHTGYELWEQLIGPPHDERHAEQVCHDFAKKAATEITGRKPLDSSTTQLALLGCTENDASFDAAYERAFSWRMNQYIQTSMRNVNQTMIFTPSWHRGPEVMPEASVPDTQAPQTASPDGRSSQQQQPQWTARQAGRGIAETALGMAEQAIDSLRSAAAAADWLATTLIGTLTFQGKPALGMHSTLQEEAVNLPLAAERNVTRPASVSPVQAPNADVVVVRSASSLHRAMWKVFSSTGTWINHYDRAGRVLLQTLRRTGNVSVAEADIVNFQAQRFIECMPRQFANVAEDEILSDYIGRVQGDESSNVVEFLNNKDRIFHEIVTRPEVTDDELLAYAESIISAPMQSAPSPVRLVEPFVRYLSRLRADFVWIDWDAAMIRIINPLQAIHALHTFKHGDEGLVEKLDGMELGRQLATGESVASLISGLTSEQLEQLDAASILYIGTRDARFRLAVPDAFPFTETLWLGDQLSYIRRKFLNSLREEWQLSKMFVANQDRSNVFISENSVKNAAGKTWSDLATDASVRRIAGFSALDVDVQRMLVKTKLQRTGEASEYRFGTLQHGMETLLKRLMLVQGLSAPESFGTEEQLLDKFIAVSMQLNSDQPRAASLWLSLGQYLAEVRGDRVTSPSATFRQNVEALLAYVRDSFLANYGMPMRFNRSAVALTVLKSRLGNTTTTEHDLTQAKREFRGQMFGRGGRVLDERKWHTILEHYLYLAESSTGDNFSINGHTFHPRAELQARELEYNDMLERHPWVEARAKENLRETGRCANEQNLSAARRVVLDSTRTQTEAERRWETFRRQMMSIPILGNLWEVGEDLAKGEWLKAASDLPGIHTLVELAEAVRTRDVRRGVLALPVVGEIYGLGESIYENDPDGAAQYSVALVWDLASLGATGGRGSGRSVDAMRVVLTESEQPVGHAIGIRHAEAMRRTLGEPPQRRPGVAEMPARIEAPMVEETQENAFSGAPDAGPGDIYAIQLTEHIDPAQAGATRRKGGWFGFEFEPYRVQNLSPDVLPNSAGIYEVGNEKFIKNDGHFYAARYDREGGTWRVYDRNNGAKWARPVRYKDGQWQYNDQAGLPGGAPLDDVTFENEINKLFDVEMKSIDAFRARREYYIRQNDKAYPNYSFDVEGIPHQSKPAEYKPGQPYFDIRTHGRPYAVMSITGKRAGPKEFAAEFTKYVKQYQPGTPIRLIACRAGLGGWFSFGQKFADAMQVPVLTYTGRVDMLEPARSANIEVLFKPSKKSQGRHRRHERYSHRKVRHLPRKVRHLGQARPSSQPGRTVSHTRAYLQQLEHSLRGWVAYDQLRKGSPSAVTILRMILQKHGEPFPPQFVQAGEIPDSVDGRLVDEAAVLYQKLQGGEMNELGCAAEAPTWEQWRSRFIEALTGEWRMSRSFVRSSESTSLRADGDPPAIRLNGRVVALPIGPSPAIHFDGFATRNAAGKLLDDLSKIHEIWSDPVLAPWSAEKKIALLRTTFAAIGEDTQYAFGTVQHSLRTVLIRVARYRGKAAINRYENDEALLRDFQRLEGEWSDQRSIFPIHPRLMLALHLTQTNGVIVASPQERDRMARKAVLWIAANAAAGNSEVMLWVDAHTRTIPDGTSRPAFLMDVLRDVSMEVGGRPDAPQKVRDLAKQLRRAGLLPELLVGNTWQEKIAAVLWLATEHLLATFGAPPAVSRADDRLKNSHWMTAKAKANVRARSKEVTSAAVQREIAQLLDSADFYTEIANKQGKFQAFQSFIDTIPSIGSTSNMTQAIQSQSATQSVLGAVGIDSDSVVAADLESGGRFVPARQKRGLADFRHVVSQLNIPTDGMADRTKSLAFADEVREIELRDGNVPLEYRLLATQVRCGLPGVKWQGYDVVLLASRDRVVPVEKTGDVYREIDWHTGRAVQHAQPIRRDRVTGQYRVD